jgi:hypothetical protein
VVGNWRLEIRDRDVAHGVATSPAAPGKDRRRAVTLLWVVYHFEMVFNGIIASLSGEVQLWLNARSVGF